ncbi:MAG: hypothetical protein H2174_04430 [Vampirovibrio sp.]|nr:hypothetical protein [Vampirovibrio sp.]
MKPLTKPLKWLNNFWNSYTSTTPADSLTVTPIDGQVLWKITPTRLAQWGQNNVKFDVKLIKADGSVQTLMKGPFTFSGL